MFFLVLTKDREISSIVFWCESQKAFCNKYLRSIQGVYDEKSDRAKERFLTN